MAKCNIKIGQDVYLFTAMSFHSSTSSHTPLLSRPLSYTRCREMFLDALKQVGKDKPTNYGLHSMRSGGATHLANRRSHNATWEVENHRCKKVVVKVLSGD